MANISKPLDTVDLGKAEGVIAMEQEGWDAS